MKRAGVSMKRAVEVMTEKELQSTIVQVARQWGWLVFYDTMPIRSVPGWPDLILLHPVWKKLLIWELKTETGLVLPAQDDWLNAWHVVVPEADVRVVRPSTLEEAYKVLTGGHARSRV